MDISEIATDQAERFRFLLSTDIAWARHRESRKCRCRINAECSNSSLPRDVEGQSYIFRFNWAHFGLDDFRGQFLLSHFTPLRAVGWQLGTRHRNFDIARSSMI